MHDISVSFAYYYKYVNTIIIGGYIVYTAAVLCHSSKLRQRPIPSSKQVYSLPGSLVDM